jgi:hypothetical protein
MWKLMGRLVANERRFPASFVLSRMIPLLGTLDDSRSIFDTLLRCGIAVDFLLF